MIYWKKLLFIDIEKTKNIRVQLFCDNKNYLLTQLELFKFIQSDQNFFQLEFPPLGQSLLEQIDTVFNQTDHVKATIVVNDLGALHYFYKKKFRIILGRAFCRSMSIFKENMLYPDTNLITFDYINKRLCNKMIMHPLLEEKTIEFLKKYRVIGIDIEEEQKFKVNDYGLILFVHENYTYMAYSSLCPHNKCYCNNFICMCKPANFHFCSLDNDELKEFNMELFFIGKFLYKRNNENEQNKSCADSFYQSNFLDLIN